MKTSCYYIEDVNLFARKHLDVVESATAHNSNLKVVLELFDKKPIRLDLICLDKNISEVEINLLRFIIVSYYGIVSKRLQFAQFKILKKLTFSIFPLI